MLTSDKTHNKVLGHPPAEDAQPADVCPDCTEGDRGRTWRETTQGVLVGMCEFHGMFSVKDTCSDGR